MNKAKHWFWHLVTMLSVCDWSNAHEWSDNEHAAYVAMMNRHGYTGAP